MPAVCYSVAIESVQGHTAYAVVPSNETMLEMENDTVFLRTQLSKYDDIVYYIGVQAPFVFLYKTLGDRAYPAPYEVKKAVNKDCVGAKNLLVNFGSGPIVQKRFDSLSRGNQIVASKLLETPVVNITDSTDPFHSVFALANLVFTQGQFKLVQVRPGFHTYKPI